MVGLLTTAGFSPQVAPDGGIELRTCPVLASARAHPGVVCTMHEEMLRAALDRAGDHEVGLRLVPFARPGACLVELGHRQPLSRSVGLPSLTTTVAFTPRRTFRMDG